MIVLLWSSQWKSIITFYCFWTSCINTLYLFIYYSPIHSYNLGITPDERLAGLKKVLLYLLCSINYAVINIWLIVLPLMLRSSGFTWINLTSDNSNIGFNLPIIILFPIINWIAESESKSNSYLYTFIVLFFLLLLCFIINSLVMFFIYHERLIILSFFISFIFIPSYHRIRTAFFSLLFSILGSIHFILPLIIVYWLLR